MDCGNEALGTAVVAATSDTEARGRAAGGMQAVVAAVGSEAGSETLLSAEAASAVLRSHLQVPVHKPLQLQWQALALSLPHHDQEVR